MTARKVPWGAGAVSSSREREATICRASAHLDGRSASGHLAHGTYEGSYWQLLSDAETLQGKLATLSRAPEFKVPAPLQLPEECPPQWEAFAPVLQPVPKPFVAAAFIAPPFVPPEAMVRPPTPCLLCGSSPVSRMHSSGDLASLQLLSFPLPLPPSLSLGVEQLAEVEEHWSFMLMAAQRMQPEPAVIPPVLRNVPFVPKTAGECPIPAFTPPEAPEEVPLVLPEATPPVPPQLPPEPEPLPAAEPEFGADWSGERPHVEEMPPFIQAELEVEPTFVLPEEPPAPLALVRLPLRHLLLVVRHSSPIPEYLGAAKDPLPAFLTPLAAGEPTGANTRRSRSKEQGEPSQRRMPAPRSQIQCMSNLAVLSRQTGPCCRPVHSRPRAWNLRF